MPLNAVVNAAMLQMKAFSLTLCPSNGHVRNIFAVLGLALGPFLFLLSSPIGPRHYKADKYSSRNATCISSP